MGFLAAILLGACAATVQAQHPSKTYKVGWLSSGSLSTSAPFIEEVKSHLRDRGYVEGRNIVFELAFGEGDAQRLALAASQLVSKAPDVIVSPATPATRAASKATSIIPIVMVAVADPVGEGFVQQLSRPGKNITGISNLALDMAAKPLDILMALEPRLKSVGVIASDNPAMARINDELTRVAARRGITVVTRAVRTLKEIEQAFAALGTSVQGLIVPGDGITFTQAKRIAQLAAAARLPAVYAYDAQVQAGGLISYGPTSRNLDKWVADYIEKILKGAEPAELSVQQPIEFELIVNLSAARAIGLAIPQDILLRADKVLQ